VTEPHELGSRPEDASEYKPDDYTLRHGETVYGSVRLAIGIMITNTNGNERRKYDEDWNKNIDERKPPY
jgi:hypothetical protein